jgi:hypothetical protein
MTRPPSLESRLAAELDLLRDHTDSLERLTADPEAHVVGKVRARQARVICHLARAEELRARLWLRDAPARGGVA